MSKRPPAELPAEEGDRSVPEHANGNEREERSQKYEDPEYESVPDRKSFDKTTKYFGMSSRGESSSAAREEVEGATAEENSASQHFYHVLDHEHGQIVEPVYSRVDKRKKGASKQSVDGDKEEVRKLRPV